MLDQFRSEIGACLVPLSARVVLSPEHDVDDAECGNHEGSIDNWGSGPHSPVRVVVVAIAVPVQLWAWH